MIHRRTNARPITLGLLLLGACAGEGERPAAQPAAGQPGLPPDLGSMTPRVVLETNKGRIVMELDRHNAPKSTGNIIDHVEQGFYNGLIFHRVRPGFMIQAGALTPELVRRQTGRPPIRNEATNGLRNVRGSVALARTNEPHSATTQFFINLVDNPRLDFPGDTLEGWGYAVFGKVVEGIDVVDAIAKVRTQQRGPHEAVPLQPVIIERAYVEQG